MNLIEEEFQNKEEKKKKRTTTIILVAIIFVFIAIIATVGYLMYLQNSTLKVLLDGKENSKVKQLIQIEDDGTVYFPIKEVASYFGYESYNGEYKDKSENASKCYIQNENEVANFSLGSNKIYKLDLTNSNDNYEYSYTKKPVKAKEGILYATSEAIEKAFNVSFQYDQDKNRIIIYTLPYLVQSYSGKVLDSGYSEISDVFANKKAILQNMLVVKKGENKNIYGVIDTQGKTILEAKYDNITYLPNVGDFLVESNKKVGVLSKNGESNIQIIYDSIDLMDCDAGLYVVKKDNKYGVLDLQGKTKIFTENDEIGIDASKFEQNNIKNRYLLAENLIPIRKDKLWGLYDKNGRKIVDFNYDSFGYVASTNKDALNLLVIPDYNVIVACKGKKYTLLNSAGEELFAPIADDIYMTIDGGEKHYWIAVNDQRMDATEFLDKKGVSSNNSTSSNKANNTTNNNSKDSNETNNDNSANNESQETSEQQDNQEQKNDENS